MSYRDLTSVQANINSYLEAFKKLLEYCSALEPSPNESNFRTVLPTVLPISWRPICGNLEKLRKDANYLSVENANLLKGIGKTEPCLLKKGYWDYDSFFKVSWQLRIPFNIYQWENAVLGYINEDGVNIPPKPAVMKEWCSPQYMCLGEISSWAMKSWALPDWWAKHQEIESFMDDNPILKDQYRKAVADADNEVLKWQKALEDVNKLTSIFKQGG